MRLLTWNINSLVPTVRNFVLTHGSLQGWLLEHRLDIACLQEVKIPEAKLTKDVACVEGFQSFWAFSRAKLGYSGVTTYAAGCWSPLGAETDCLGGGEEDFDLEGRVVCTDHGAFVLINVYVPHAGPAPERPRRPTKLAFLAALKRRAEALMAAGREVLIVGDLNVALERIDIHPCFGAPESVYSAEECHLLAALTHSFPDVWRRHHPGTEGVYTVWSEKTSGRSFNEGLRIDFVLASPGLLEHVVSCEVLDTPPKWSDHAGVILELEGLEPQPAHPPCALSSSKMKRFNDRSQPSVATMFGRKRPAGDAVYVDRPTKLAAAGSRPASGAVHLTSATPLLPAPLKDEHLISSPESLGTTAGGASAVRRDSAAAGVVDDDGGIDTSAGDSTGAAAAGSSSASHVVLHRECCDAVEGSVGGSGHAAGIVGCEGGAGQRQRHMRSKPTTPRDKGQRSMQSFFTKKS